MIRSERCMPLSTACENIFDAGITTVIENVGTSRVTTIKNNIPVNELLYT